MKLRAGGEKMMDCFNRILRFKDLEVWDVQFENDRYRMIIFDENRQAVADDLDLPSGLGIEEDDLRKNLITVKVYSENRVKDAHIEPLDQFAKQLTDHIALAHCHVIITFHIDVIEDVLDRLVLEKINMQYDEIPLRQLWHLNQN